MTNSEGESLLRPINYNESLVRSWERNFVKEVYTILKGFHLVPEDLKREFRHGMRNYKIIGSFESSKEILLLEDQTNLWAIDRWELSKILYPEKHAAWINEKKMVPYVEPKKKAVRAKK